MGFERQNQSLSVCMINNPPRARLRRTPLPACREGPGEKFYEKRHFHVLVFDYLNFL
jgi:hypothetical protein